MSASTTGVDDAFQQRVKTVLKKLSEKEKKRPSAVASPILRHILLHPPTNNNNSAPPKVEEKQTTTSAPVKEGGEEDPVPAKSSVAASLAKRGLGPKDPLLKRLQARKAAAAASPNSAAASAAWKGWMGKKLSEMNETSWSVFKEQIGLTTELITHHGASRRVTLPPPIRCWEEAGLPFTLTQLLTHRFSFPTAVQSQCVPLICPNKNNTERGGLLDVLCVADTGSGKTAAYLVPLLAKISRQLSSRTTPFPIHDGPIALVTTPTRELAEQVYAELLYFTTGANEQHRVPPTLLQQWEEESKKSEGRTAMPLSQIKVMRVIGGGGSTALEAQYEQLSGEGCHLLIGTVAQLEVLLDHKYLSLLNTTTVVVDEADRMLEEQETARTLLSVLERCPAMKETPRTTGQLLLFTATLDKKCEGIVRQYMSDNGHAVVKTVQKCAAIRQTFEVFSAHVTYNQANDEQEEKEGEEGRKTRRKGHAGSAQQRNTIRHKDMIHPEKLSRLVSWLSYVDGSTIVFVNEKSVCDALYEELNRMFRYLQNSLDESEMKRNNKNAGNINDTNHNNEVSVALLKTMVGPPPEGLRFMERGDDESAINSNISPSLQNLSSMAVIHSDLTQSERTQLIQLFKQQKKRVILTTDLLARGLDVPGVSTVINYDMPYPFASRHHNNNNNEGDSNSTNNNFSTAFSFYVHRIGRTGRAGAVGVAVSFILLEESLLLQVMQGDRDKQRQDKPLSYWEEVRQNDAEMKTDKKEESGESEGEADEEEETPRENRKRGRVVMKKEKDVVHYYFQSDAKLLPFLYSFLLNCVDETDRHNNNNKAVKKEELLRHQKYRVVLPPALYTTMTDMLNASSYGTITL